MSIAAFEAIVVVTDDTEQMTVSYAILPEGLQRHRLDRVAGRYDRDGVPEDAYAQQLSFRAARSDGGRC